jgi:hypothetical protein
MAESIVLYGPQGSGKSLNAEAIRQAYGLETIVELDEILYTRGSEGFDPIGQLIVTHDDRWACALARQWGLPTVHVDAARERVGAAWRSQP